jgi:ketosteroid isomerase-like protein
MAPMAKMARRLQAAMNAHDLDAFVACFKADYVSAQPAHPGRAFTGAEQVRRNWSGVFAGVPDLRAELVASAETAAGVEMSEWVWRGTHTDGSAFAMTGVIVLGVAQDQIGWARLYMEPIEDDGADIDQMVRETYRPPAD